MVQFPGGITGDFVVLSGISILAFFDQESSGKLTSTHVSFLYCSQREDIVMATQHWLHSPYTAGFLSRGIKV